MERAKTMVLTNTIARAHLHGKAKHAKRVFSHLRDHLFSLNEAHILIIF